MKLYFKTGACSLAVRIAASELGIAIDDEAVDTKAQKTASGADFKSINPKGYVPALALDGGQGVLTEAQVILQYLADSKPEKKLLPAPGSIERYRALEWLNWISSELHKGIGVMFGFREQPEHQAIWRERALPKLAYLDAHLAKNDFVLGKEFSAADAYAFVVLGWTKPLKVDLSAYPHVLAYMSRVRERPAVQAALKAEGLLK